MTNMCAKGSRLPRKKHERLGTTTPQELKIFKIEILAECGMGQKAFNNKLAVVTVCSEASTRRRSSGTRIGVYLDSPDLKQKFEGKPEQLNHARDRTDTMYRETLGVTLYKRP